MELTLDDLCLCLLIPQSIQDYQTPSLSNTFLCRQTKTEVANDDDDDADGCCIEKVVVLCWMMVNRVVAEAFTD